MAQTRRMRHFRGFMPTPSHHPRDPLHGVTLETIVRRLVERHGWEVMGSRIPIRCFLLDPSVKSTLTFLRKTPWARKKVEDWFAEEATDFLTDANEDVTGEMRPDHYSQKPETRLPSAPPPP